MLCWQLAALQTLNKSLCTTNFHVHYTHYHHDRDKSTADSSLIMGPVLLPSDQHKFGTVQMKVNKLIEIDTEVIQSKP